MNRFMKMAGMIAIAGLLVGCSKSTSTEETNHDLGTSQNTKQEVVEMTQESTSEITPEATITDNLTDSGADDTEQTDRVVVGSVALVKILDELGVSMVGVPTSSYELPESVADVTRIGEPMNPDMEVIYSLDPTVMVALDSISESYQTSFVEKNIESLTVSLSGYEDLRNTIKVLGERFLKVEKADEILANFDDREASIMANIEGKDQPTVMIIFGTPGSFMMATNQSYVGDLVKRLGGINVVEDETTSFIGVDMEYLADKNPDLILTMSHANPEVMEQVFAQEFETNALWQHFDAVKEGKVINLDNNYFGMSADLSVMDAMEMLEDILYQ